MNTADLEHNLNGTTPMPKCNDLYTLLGVVKGKSTVQLKLNKITQKQKNI